MDDDGILTVTTPTGVIRTTRPPGHPTHAGVGRNPTAVLDS